MRHRDESTPSSLEGGYNSEGHRKFILPRGCMEIAQHSGDMELILTLQDKGGPHFSCFGENDQQLNALGILWLLFTGFLKGATFHERPGRANSQMNAS